MSYLLDLQVKEDAVGNQNQTKVTCSTSCSLGSQYVWYKNGQTLRGKTTASILLDSTRPSEEGSYSCAVKGHEGHRSPAVWQGQGFPGLPGVNISVTALQVCITPEAVAEGQRVTLTCNTTCRLSNDPTFIWYQNRQTVTYKHTTRDKLYLNPVSSEDAGNYSCAVRGHESLSSTAVFLNVRYSPRKTSLSISPGGTEGGTSVTLTCSSDANPPVHTYTWYLKNGTEYVVRGTGESISFNVTSDTSGLYYCEAQNELGSQNSTDAAVPSKGSEAVMILLVTISIVLALLLVGIVFLRKKKAKITAVTRSTDANMQSDSGLLNSNVTVRATTSDPTQRVTTHDQDDQYASIKLNRSYRQEGPLHSIFQKPQTSAQDDVVYASVQFHRGSAATRAKDDDVN
ncbi:carcinoembryonic antigen-related cell adhesion molecule 5-like [Sardina pilchardus]|uniref:carcinoembryonic antigen-related cell adhesion molecule 5-like n=1 Tax=Sardina pilchardus TaxID=27697 RepID=UPI002E0F9B41